MQRYIDEKKVADVIMQFFKDFNAIAEENKIVIEEFSSIKELAYCLTDRLADSDIYET